MDTFRKWLNKPKADDKSLLARFYHADRSLTAVTSELDSFDGRAEPDRCSRLVSRLRQGQDKVLAITNLIMEELLGEDRDPRAFRAKFPEEVLQENLAGQLWFGAECLAAGSSIMNREQESKEMRPLAQAVTRSLGNVRNLLRDQCLRNNVPNSKTLHLDINDSTTEQLYESLKIFDRLFAEFELRYVSAMVPVKTKHEYEMQELISVLFSETLHRALKNGLIDQEKVDAFDPALMFSIPRLAIISGLVIYPEGPLDMNMPSDELSEMFRPFRTILIKIRDLLNTLDKNDLFQLEKLLCTNEDINTQVPVGTSSIEAPCPEQQSATTAKTTTTTAGKNNKTSSTNCDDENNQRSNAANPPTTTTTTEAQVSVTSSLSKVLKHRHNHQQQQHSRYLTKIRSPSISSVSANSSVTSTPTVSPTPSPTPSNSLASSASSAAATSTTSAADFSDDDNDDIDSDEIDEDDDDSEAAVHDVVDENADIVAADCASGYLIPNTNFGNLLQPQEVALNGNFIASEDELSINQENQENPFNADEEQSIPFVDEDVPTSSSRLRHSMQQQPNTNENNINNNNSNSSNSDIPSTSQITNEKTLSNCRHHHHSQQHHHHHRRSRHHHHHHHHHQHSKLKRCHQGGGSSSSGTTLTNECNAAECDTHAEDQKSPANSPTHRHHNQKQQQQQHDISSVDSRTSSSMSDAGESPRDAALVALRTNGRLKFKSTENLLHRLFVCIAGVADQLQTNFASDLRHILRSVFLMNMSVTQDDELDIPEKTKESELFEFRASENDVIQESGNGSNQSIYSAEEVNPELDNVFNNNNNSHNNSHSSGSSRSSMSSAESSGHHQNNQNNNNNSNSNATRHSTGSSIQRVNTLDLSTNEPNSNLIRNHVERSRSLGDHEQQADGSNSRSLSAYISGRRLSSTSSTMSQQNHNNNAGSTTSTANASMRHQQQLQRHRNNSVGSNSPGSSSTSSSSSSESNSPISERANNARCLEISTATVVNNNNNDNSSSNSTNAQINATTTLAATANTNTNTTTTCLAPPAWIPDDKAPRCMSCRTQFTAFRRRHHCRNCGGVFCSVCSNASAPLPKYGLTKAVRVCRECYVREVRGVRSTQTQLNAAAHHQAANTATAGGS